MALWLPAAAYCCLLLPAAAAVAAAVASFQMVGGKCLIPWRAPPCAGRGQHGTRVCNACHVATVQAAIRKRAAALNAEPQKGPNVTSETLL